MRGLGAEHGNPMSRLGQRCPVRRVWRALTARRAAPAPVQAAPVDVIPVNSVGSEGWRARELLTDADLSDFLALRRVCGRPDSPVTQVGDYFYEGERRLLSHVEDGVGMLIEVGFATLGKSDPEYGRRPVTATSDGRERYEHLCERHGYPPYLDPRSTTEGWQF